MPQETDEIKGFRRLDATGGNAGKRYFLPSEGRGQGFESLRVRHLSLPCRDVPVLVTRLVTPRFGAGVHWIAFSGRRPRCFR